jgi:prephenate dehydrogenase
LHKSVGKEVGLKHIYSGKIHVGVLESVDGKTAVLKSGNKTKNLRIANIDVLSDAELQEWKIHNLKHEKQSISCVFSKNVNVNVIEDTVLNMDNIIDIRLIDAYNGPQIDENSISLTFEVEALSKSDIENVIKLFTGFGGTIR